MRGREGMGKTPGDFGGDDLSAGDILMDKLETAWEAVHDLENCIAAYRSRLGRALGMDGAHQAAMTDVVRMVEVDLAHRRLLLGGFPEHLKRHHADGSWCAAWSNCTRTHRLPEPP